MFEETEEKSCLAPTQYFYFITSVLLKIRWNCGPDVGHPTNMVRYNFTDLCNIKLSVTHLKWLIAVHYLQLITVPVNKRFNVSITNIEARLCNRWCGKEISITYSVCVSVALLIQHAKHIGYIFPHYHINGTIFEKRMLLNMEGVFWYSLLLWLTHFSF